MVSPRGWHSEDIKAAVRKRGITLEELSVRCGLEPKACSSALRRPHFDAEWAIADFLGVSPRQIWPQRYNADGAYKHPRSEKHHTRRIRAGERQNGAAA